MGQLTRFGCLTYMRKVVPSNCFTGRPKAVLLLWILCLSPTFNDNIHHEGNISKMPDFDVFLFWNVKKR